MSAPTPGAIISFFGFPEALRIGNPVSEKLSCFLSHGKPESFCLSTFPSRRASGNEHIVRIVISVMDVMGMIVG